MPSHRSDHHRWLRTTLLVARRCLQLVVLTLVLAGAGGVAQAQFATSDSDPLSAGTATMTVPEAPGVTSTSNAAVVTWKATALSNGRAPTGYEVRRHTGSDSTVVCTTTTALTCHDSRPAVTVSYTVTAAYRAWSKRSNATTYTVAAPAATSTFQVNDSPGPSGWYERSAVSVSISATATGGSTVRSITYRVNGGAAVVTQGASIGFSVGQQGENTITYFATDSAGNPEAERTAHVKLDNKVPGLAVTSRTGDMTHAQWKATCAGRVSSGGLCGTASDAASGVASVGYKLTRSSDNKCFNGSSWVGSCSNRVAANVDDDEWYAPIPDAKLATGRTWYTVTVYATDVAGNETNTTKNFSVGP